VEIASSSPLRFDRSAHWKKAGTSDIEGGTQQNKKGGLKKGHRSWKKHKSSNEETRFSVAIIKFSRPIAGIQKEIVRFPRHSPRSSAGSCHSSAGSPNASARGSNSLGNRQHQTQSVKTRRLAWPVPGSQDRQFERQRF